MKVPYHLAVALAAQGDFEEAGKEFRESVRNEPNLAEAHAGLARLLAAQKKPEEAMRHYQEALRIVKKEQKAGGSVDSKQ